MSGVVNAVKTVFQDVVNVVKQVAPVILVAAAVYFTAGMALSAFPATASFAAAMPGFASTGAIDLAADGSVAGTGALSDLAATSGLGADTTLSTVAADATADTAADASGLSEIAVAPDAAAQASLDAGAVPGTGAAASGAASGGAAGTNLSAAEIQPPAAPAVPAPPTAPTLDAAGNLGQQGVLASAAQGLGKMSLADKFLLASTGANLISGLTAPSYSDMVRAQKSFYGSYYGTAANGTGAPVTPESFGPNTNPYGPNNTQVQPGQKLSTNVNPAPAAPTTNPNQNAPTTSGASGATSYGAYQPPTTAGVPSTPGPQLIPNATSQAYAASNAAQNSSQVAAGQAPTLIPRYV